MAAADVALLRDMFASVDLDVIKIVLAECGNNVERAIDALLQLDPAGSGGSPAPAAKPAAPAPAKAAAAPKAMGYDQDFNPRAPDPPAPKVPRWHTFVTHPCQAPVIDDEALARALQAQLNADEADAEYAAAEEQAMAAPRYHHSIQPVAAAEPKYKPNMSISDFLGAVGEDDMNEMIDTIKEQMIPLIVDQMRQIDIPPINEEIESPGLGSRLSFTVSGISLDHIEVPQDNLTCAIQNGGVKIQIGNISARVKKFNWSYKKETFPKLKASMQDTTITLSLQLSGSSLASTRVTVSECAVKIGKLDVKIGGTVASFIYNIIIAAFSSSIRKSIEGQMQDMIRNAINESASSLLEDL